MSTALFDPEALDVFDDLITGNLKSRDQLPELECILRSILLHDDISVQRYIRPKGSIRLLEYNGPGPRLTDEVVALALPGILDEYGFLTFAGLSDVSNIQLSPTLIEIASRHARADRGEVHFETHVNYLKNVVSVVQSGGSLHLQSPLAREAVQSASEFPQSLFNRLDRRWQEYAKTIEADRLGILIPPVLGIILSRCARRGAITVVVRDLRDEWADARKKVWSLLNALRTARTLSEAVDIRRDLSEASMLFAPEPTEHYSRPVRVLWELMAVAAAGAGTATMLHSAPMIGAITGAMAHASRSVPMLLDEFGPAVFGRGAFDLARRVRRATAEVRLDVLARLLTDTEKRHLGLQ